MRIAQVSPLYESVPPKFYGGTERVVSYLTEELTRQGHEVTLFASGDSITAARLVAPCPKALRLDPECQDQMAPHLLQLEMVQQQADRFDIIHYHIDYLHYPLSRRMGSPHVTTLHGRLDIPELARLYREFDDVPLVSISDNQRRPLHWANWIGTVHHGLPEDLYRLYDKPEPYLAFLGRVSAEKRLDRAIEIAKCVGLKLKIAAKVDKKDQDYFDEVIVPLLDHPLVEFIGEIGEQDKNAFLGNASVFLFPIDWSEPFGLVMIESMACGTPVIAWRCGSVPEILDEGVTGFIVENLDAAARAVRAALHLDRAAIRRQFETRFSAARMARDYVDAYQRLIDNQGEIPVEEELSGTDA